MRCAGVESERERERGILVSCMVGFAVGCMVVQIPRFQKLELCGTFHSILLSAEFTAPELASSNPKPRCSPLSSSPYSPSSSSLPHKQNHITTLSTTASSPSPPPPLPLLPSSHTEPSPSSPIHRTPPPSPNPPQARTQPRTANSASR